MQPMRVDLVTKGDPLYNSVCQNAGDIYEQHLKLRPIHYPEQFVALFEPDGTPIGGGGIHKAAQNPKLLIDTLMQPHHSTKTCFLSTYGGSQRNWAEISCFHMRQGFEKATPLALGLTFWFLQQGMRVPVTLNVLTRILRTFLGKVGIKICDLCGVNPDLIKGTPDAFMQAFITNYLEPRRRPMCVGIDVNQAASAFADYWLSGSFSDHVVFGKAFGAKAAMPSKPTELLAA